MGRRTLNHQDGLAMPTKTCPDGCAPDPRSGSTSAPTSSSPASSSSTRTRARHATREARSVCSSTRAGRTGDAARATPSVSSPCASAMFLSRPIGSWRTRSLHPSRVLGRSMRSIWSSKGCSKRSASGNLRSLVGQSSTHAGILRHHEGQGHAACAPRRAVLRGKRGRPSRTGLPAALRRYRCSRRSGRR